VKQPLAENNKKLQKFTEYDTAARNIARANGYFDEAEPVNAVQTLGLALFDIFTAKKQIPGQCLAKDTADREMEAIATHVQTLKSEIAHIDSLLLERSGQ
jgi:hypothetical protein